MQRKNTEIILSVCYGRMDFERLTHFRQDVRVLIGSYYR